MNRLSVVIGLLAIADICISARLPSSFKKCSRRQPDLNSCFPEAIESALRQLKKPFREIGLPSLSPLEVPSLVIDAGRGAVAFRQNYKNLKVSGLTESTCSKAEVSFEKKTVFLECLTPLFKMDFDYEVDGKVLLLPLVGQGTGSITLENLRDQFHVNLEEYEKKNKKHYRVISSNISMEPSLIKFDLDNLFNGDKTLSASILRVMNENWKELFADVRSNYEDALAQIFSSLFNNVLGRVPAEDLFGE